MSESDIFGDSDDEALIIAATQVGATEAQNGFEGSPRPAKRRRVAREVEDTEDDGFSSGSRRSQALGGSQSDPAHAGDDVLVDEEQQEDAFRQKPKYLTYTPKINANLDRLIVAQTQTAAPSQPWAIRGPIWRKPKPVGNGLNASSISDVQGSEDRVPTLLSEDEDEIEEIASRTSTVGVVAFAPQGTLL